MSDSKIMSWVGGVTKDSSEEEWKAMNVSQALREGRELYDWQYIPDPDPRVFKHGEARISYLTRPLVEFCGDFGYRQEVTGLTPYCKQGRFIGLSCNSTLKPKIECYWEIGGQ